MNEGKEEVKKMDKKDMMKLVERIGIYMEVKGDNGFKISALRKGGGGVEDGE